MLDIEDDKVADKLHKMVVDNVVEEVADKVVVAISVGHRARVPRGCERRSPPGPKPTRRSRARRAHSLLVYF